MLKSLPLINNTIIIIRERFYSLHGEGKVKIYVPWPTTGWYGNSSGRSLWDCMGGPSRPPQCGFKEEFKMPRQAAELFVYLKVQTTPYQFYIC